MYQNTTDPKPTKNLDATNNICKHATNLEMTNWSSRINYVYLGPNKNYEKGSLQNSISERKVKSKFKHTL